SRFIRPRSTVSGWGLRSVAQSWKRTAGACGSPTTRNTAPPSVWLWTSRRLSASARVMPQAPALRSMKRMEDPIVEGLDHRVDLVRNLGGRKNGPPRRSRVASRARRCGETPRRVSWRHGRERRWPRSSGRAAGARRGHGGRRCGGPLLSHRLAPNTEPLIHLYMERFSVAGRRRIGARAPAARGLCPGPRGGAWPPPALAPALPPARARLRPVPDPA